MTNTFKGGLDLKFINNSDFESLEHVDLVHQDSIIARNALRFLMMGWPSDSWKQLFSWRVFKAVFVHRDPNLLKELRLAFQQGFEFLFNQLHNQKLDPCQKEQAQLYLSNCLSLLPYSDLNPYESIKIPQNINDEWVLVEYEVIPIELTPKAGFKSYFIEDTDRVFAYALEPISNRQAESHLIFMGTTYPAGQGFIPQIKTDFKGFETVGESLYTSGRERIKKWLLRQHNKVHVCGVSLGGSLSLLLAIDQGMHLKRVDALNPAGLHDSWYKNQYDRWDLLNTKPQVVVQQQADDPVSLLGVWKHGWQILQVEPPLDKKGPNLLCDHFLNYAGFAQTEFTYVDPDIENTQRRTRNFWFYSVGRSLIYYSTIVPYSYLIRPIFLTVLKNSLPFIIGTIALMGISVLMACSITGLIPTLLVINTLFASTLFGCLSIIHVCNSDKDESREFAKIHDPSQPRNTSMDIYNKENKIEIELSYQQLNTYYKVKRCLVKEQSFLPCKDKSEHFVKDLSKKELLLASEQPENGQKKVFATTTKAKAIHIRHVLTLVDKLGVENTQQLKEAVEQEYHQYSRGKQSYIRLGLSP